MYAPVLRALRDDFKVVGVTSRTLASTRRASAALGCTPYEQLTALARDARPDLVVVAVSAPSNAAVAVQAIEVGCGVLLETPIAEGPSDAARVCAAAARAHAPVAVAEQTPFLPAECFKRQLINSGAFGQIIVVENDYRSYDYHAIAQLRRYMAHDARPVTAHAVRASFALDPYERLEPAGDVLTGPRVETWELGTVKFDDGTLLLHRFTSIYKVAPFRTFQSLRIYGTRGSAVNDEVVVLDRHGRSVRLRVEENFVVLGRAPSAITVTLPEGQAVRWENPFADRGFTNDQVGVALHLDALRAALLTGRQPLYSTHDALRDVEIIDAFRRSAGADGAPVPVTHQCADPRCVRQPIVDQAVRLKKWMFGARGRAGLLRLRGRARRELRRIF
jgi:predicted dehydrogenase